LRKTEPERADTVLYILIDVIRILGIYVQSVVPGSAAKLLDQVSTPKDKRLFEHISDRIAPGTELPEPSPIFPRYVDLEEGAKAPV